MFLIEEVQAGRDAMETEALRQEIDALTAVLGSDASIAKPAAERSVLEKIRMLLDRTREERTGAALEIWTAYLPYAARLCFQLSKLEEGWEDPLDYFASENAQFWVDHTASLLEQGDITGVVNGLRQVLEATRMIKQDMVMRVDLLLQALDIALEITDKKQSILLYEEADKLYRKHLAGGEQYTGSAWLGKIKKMGQQIAQYREKLGRYFHHAETVTVSIEADTERDLERVIDYLQQSLVGKVKITRRAKAAGGQGKPAGFRARVKITLE